MDNFREWLSDNLRYILLGLAIGLAVIIIICVAKLAGGSSKKSGSAGENSQPAAVETEQSAASSSAAPSGSSSNLQKDDSAILNLVQKYYTAVASGDTATLATIVDPWNDEIQNSILKNDVIESYDNISTYSKAGPENGTYIVYAYYDARIRNISTEAPSLALLYLVTNDSGDLVVGDRNASAEIADFISKATAASDVQALKNDVNQKLMDAEASDPDLAAFIDGQSSGASSEQSTEADSSSGTGTSGGTATTTAGVNIRAEASPDGAIVCVTYAGAEVTVIEKGADWTHVNFTYNGTTYDGYISTQYLDFGDSSSSDASSSAADASSADTSSAAGNTGASDAGGVV